MNNILKMIYMELIGELGAIPLYRNAKEALKKPMFREITAL